MYLLTIRHAAVIFTPRRLLCIGKQIDARDVVVVADFGPAHTAEKLFRRIRAGAVLGICLFVLDALYLETRV